MNTLNRRAAWRAWPLTKLNLPVKIIGGAQDPPPPPAPPHATTLKRWHFKILWDITGESSFAMVTLKLNDSPLFKFFVAFFLLITIRKERVKFEINYVLRLFSFRLLCTAPSKSPSFEVSEEQSEFRLSVTMFFAITVLLSPVLTSVLLLTYSGRGSSRAILIRSFHTTWSSIASLISLILSNPVSAVMVSMYVVLDLPRFGWHCWGCQSSTFSVTSI